MKDKSILLFFILFINLPVVARDYNILDFGAVKGKLSTIAIQKAVDECFTAGGGRVVVRGRVRVAARVDIVGAQRRRLDGWTSGTGPGEQGRHPRRVDAVDL